MGAGAGGAGGGPGGAGEALGGAGEALGGAGAPGHRSAGTAAAAAADDVPLAPRLLSHRAEPTPLPPPVQEADEIASLHVKFARLVSGVQGEQPHAEGTVGAGATGGGAGPGRVRAKVRARVAAVARADAGADREFMGNLVRAVAALAERVDDVSTRVGALEVLVQDVLDRVSEDLARAHAALGALGDDDDRAT